MDFAKDFVQNKASTSINNCINRGQNLATLKRKLDELIAIKDDNETKKAVVLQSRKKLKKDVEHWFQDVERIHGEIQNEAKGSKFSLGRFLGSDVLKWKEEVDELIQRGRSYDSLAIDDPQLIGQFLSTTNLVGEEAKNTMNEIWAYLMDDHVGGIRVWGMGGVGKTTIMKHIHDKLLEETKKFNIVMWITVPKESDIVKLQDFIARAMRKSLLEDDDVTRRARRIHEMLSQKGKYVLILDDVWDEKSLEKAGIPKPPIGCKLVVTTRQLDVGSYLGCQQVRVPTLSKQDASNLFFEKLGTDLSNDQNLSPDVDAVIERCAGLPLAIVTVASSMRGKVEIDEWKNVLIELERRAQSVNKLGEEVLQVLKFSYDHLEIDKLKQCFLYCSLWPKDYRIIRDELIKFWIVEGLVEELESMEEEICRGRTILNILIRNCLVENIVEDGESYVKLHDLVRDMALDITTSGKPQFLVRAGIELERFPDLKECAEDLDKVSLMENRRLQIPSQMPPPKCHALTTLLLSSCNIDSIPECFFEQLHGLKILDLSRNPIERLPKSISDLKTLTALLLEGCDRLKTMPSFSELQALKKLNLGGTKIENLPNGMERLVELKYLNFSGTCIPKIPNGILSKFSCLQLLEAIRDLELSQRFVSVDEIVGLKKLEIFRGRFRKLKELSNYVHASYGQTQWPRKYYISVDGGLLLSKFNEEKCIGLSGCQIYRNGAKFPSDIRELIICRCSIELPEELLFSRFISVPHGTFSALRQIKIRFCKKIKKLFSFDWVLKNLQNLVVLKVWYCDEVEEIIASASELEEEGMDSSNTLNPALPKLSYLSLRGLRELKSSYSTKETMVCDSLQLVQITHCQKLKRLPLYLPLLEEGRPSHPPLKNLEKLEVRDCGEMEEIIASASELEEEGMNSSSTFNLALPKLKELRLKMLPNLKSIYSAKGAMVCDSLRHVQIIDCPKLKRIPLYLPLLEEGRPSPPPSLKKLETLEVWDCDEMEEIIALVSELEEEGMDSGSTLKLALPKLKELRLKMLPNLKSIYSAKGAMVCDSLQTVWIENCPKLKRIPLYLPLLKEGQPSPPPSLQTIFISEMEWENMEWDHPNAKSVLESFVKFF